MYPKQCPVCGGYVEQAYRKYCGISCRKIGKSKLKLIRKYATLSPSKEGS